MKVRDLIDILSDHDPEAEVRMMIQPSYPLEAGLDGVVSDGQIREHEDEPEEGEPVVYLLQGSHVGYGRPAAWEVS